MERRNIIYGSVLVLLCLALVTVAVLILRKRSLTSPAAVRSSATTGKKQARPDFRPLDSYQRAAPLPPGQPSSFENGRLMIEEGR